AAVAAGRIWLRAAEQAGHLGRVAGKDLGHAEAVVEADERVGNHEAALRQVPAGLGDRNGRLEPRDVVITEVAHHRPAERFGLLEADETRARPDKRVTAETPVLDRLQQERGNPGLAQPQVSPEWGEEIC